MDKIRSGEFVSPQIGKMGKAVKKTSLSGINLKYGY